LGSLNFYKMLQLVLNKLRLTYIFSFDTFYIFKNNWMLLY